MPSCANWDLLYANFYTHVCRQKFCMEVENFYLCNGREIYGREKMTDYEIL